MEESGIDREKGREKKHFQYFHKELILKLVPVLESGDKVGKFKDCRTQRYSGGENASIVVLSCVCFLVCIYI